MKRSLAILATLVLALGMVGAGYAAWTSNLNIYATINTGTLSWKFIDVTTDAGFRKFHNRQHGHALALDKMHQPHRRLKAKVGTTDANAKDAAYRKAIGEEGNEEGLPNKSEWEYDKEGDMAKDQIHTIIRHAEELEHALGDDENLPEWVQEKLAQIKGMMVSVGDYMLT